MTMTPGSVVLPSTLKKPSTSSLKMKASQSKARKSLHTGESQGATGTKTLSRKLMKMISPKHHIKKFLDAYIAFMVKLAGSKQMSLAGSTGMHGGWPCMVQPLKYPGRQPQEHQLMEELECANYVAKLEVPQHKRPPCARKAVFPL